MKTKMVACALLCLLPLIILLSVNSFTRNSDTENIGLSKESAFFSIEVASAKLIQEDSRKEICYELSIENKTDQRFENLEIFLKPPAILNQYLAAGVLMHPMGTITLAAQNAVEFSGNDSTGMDADLRRLINSDEFLSEAGLDYRDIVTLAQTIEVHFKWDGGAESVELCTTVIDEIAQ